MRRTVGALALGSLALVVQGALASWLPAPACPDLGLLVVVALGLYWRGAASGLVLAAVLGYGADLLSGSLVGEHALLRVCAFAAARMASRQLNLRGALPLACFVLGLTAVYALAVAWLGSIFGAGAQLGPGRGGEILLHAAVNAVCAPAVSRLCEVVLGWASDDEKGRRPLTLEARRRWA